MRLRSWLREWWPAIVIVSLIITVVALILFGDSVYCAAHPGYCANVTNVAVGPHELMNLIPFISGASLVLLIVSWLLHRDARKEKA